MVSCCSFTALFLNFADSKLAVQTKSTGADNELESRPPKSSDSELAVPADKEIVEPEVSTDSEAEIKMGFFIQDNK